MYSETKLKELLKTGRAKCIFDGELYLTKGKSYNVWDEYDGGCYSGYKGDGIGRADGYGYRDGYGNNKGYGSGSGYGYSYGYGYPDGSGTGEDI